MSEFFVSHSKSTDAVVTGSRIEALWRRLACLEQAFHFASPRSQRSDASATRVLAMAVRWPLLSRLPIARRLLFAFSPAAGFPGASAEQILAVLARHYSSTGEYHAGSLLIALLSALRHEKFSHSANNSTLGISQGDALRKALDLVALVIALDHEPDLHAAKPRRRELEIGNCSEYFIACKYTQSVNQDYFSLFFQGHGTHRERCKGYFYELRNHINGATDNQMIPASTNLLNCAQARHKSIVIQPERAIADAPAVDTFDGDDLERRVLLQAAWATNASRGENLEQHIHVDDYFSRSGFNVKEKLHSARKYFSLDHYSSRGRKRSTGKSPLRRKSANVYVLRAVDCTKYKALDKIRSISEFHPGTLSNIPPEENPELLHWIGHVSLDSFAQNIAEILELEAKAKDLADIRAMMESKPLPPQPLAKVSNDM